MKEVYPSLFSDVGGAKRHVRIIRSLRFWNTILIAAVLALGMHVLFGCADGPREVEANQFSRIKNIPMNVSDSYWAPLDTAVDQAHDVVEQHFQVSVPMPKVVAFETDDEVTKDCNLSSHVYGCYWNDEIFVSNNDGRELTLCDLLVHEWGHLYFEKTEGDMDSQHKHHADYFEWAVMACEPKAEEKS